MYSVGFFAPLLHSSGSSSYTLCTGGDFEPAPSLTKKYSTTVLLDKLLSCVFTAIHFLTLKFQ